MVTAALPRSLLMPIDDAIKRSLALLRSTFESTADGLLVVDREGRIVAHNRRPSQLYPSKQSVRVIDYEFPR